jgi:hypothetical protein
VIHSIERATTLLTEDTSFQQRLNKLRSKLQLGTN